MTVGIIGGGIAALSLSHFLDEESIILEKEKTAGGLCRSFDFNGIPFDIGPHIIFSKNQDVLQLHNSICKVSQHQRLNRIFLDGRFIKYPFENNLGSLESSMKDYCLSEFLNNPYKGIVANNMAQFFLEYFGEGISDTYLYPYNKKIWKLDPSFLDMQMVERIPRPPVDDVIAGAQGSPKEGYTHQSVFSYPTTGGFQSLINSYLEILSRKKVDIRLGAQVKKVIKIDDKWELKLESGETFRCDQLVSTIPLTSLHFLIDVPSRIRQLSEQALHNSIHIVMLRYRGDALEDQFALYVPNKDVLFHRLSRLNFLGEAYGANSGDLILMAEITYRPNSYLSKLQTASITERCVKDLEDMGIVPKQRLKDSLVMSFPHAYVIYDLNHRVRTDELLKFYRNLGVICHGRFGKFEYQNSDAVVEDSISLAKKLNNK